MPWGVETMDPGCAQKVPGAGSASWSRTAEESCASAIDPSAGDPSAGDPSTGDGPASDAAALPSAGAFDGDEELLEHSLTARALTMQATRNLMGTCLSGGAHKLSSTSQCMSSAPRKSKGKRLLFIETETCE
jgi:hypothetical protein